MKVGDIIEKIINIIIEKNKNLFGDNLSLKKINVGFTNTVYNINDSFIVKICSNINNENEFKKEIDFYKANENNTLIPKLYYSDTQKIDVPYIYEIIEKVEYEDGNIAQALFTLQEQPFRVMDARDKHDFDFTMAFSIYIDCENQEEIDRLWQQVTAKGKEWPCGWMEDQFGISWQTGNPELKRYLSDSNPARANEVTKKLYQMKKIDLNQLKEVYEKYNH